MSTAAAQRKSYRSWQGAFAILIAILAYVGGLQWWDRATPGERTLDTNQELVLGPVRFIPAAGWQLDLSRSRPGRTLVLAKESHLFRISIFDWAGGPKGALDRHRRLMERVQGLQIDGRETSFINAWGIEGKTLAYYGPHVAGRIWQVVDLHHHILILIDLSGDNEAPGNAPQEARAMVDSLDTSATP